MQTQRKAGPHSSVLGIPERTRTARKEKSSNKTIKKRANASNKDKEDSVKSEPFFQFQLAIACKPFEELLHDQGPEQDHAHSEPIELVFGNIPEQLSSAPIQSAQSAVSASNQPQTAATEATLRAIDIEYMILIN